MIYKCYLGSTFLCKSTYKLNIIKLLRRNLKEHALALVLHSWIHISITVSNHDNMYIQNSQKNMSLIACFLALGDHNPSVNVDDGEGEEGVNITTIYGVLLQNKTQSHYISFNRTQTIHDVKLQYSI